MHYHGKLSGANQPTFTAGASKTFHAGHAKMETESEKITERAEGVQKSVKTEMVKLRLFHVNE